MSNLPAAVDAEQVILGAILMDKTALEKTTYLKADDFYLPAHQQVFCAMAYLAEERQPIDLVTLAEEMRQRKTYESSGGINFLATLTEGLPRRLAIENYVSIVREKAALRSIILTAHNAILAASQPDATSDKIAAGLRNQMNGISEDLEQGTFDGIRMIGEYAVEFMERLKIQRESNGEVVGLTYGIKCLDTVTTGMRKAENTVVGGRPGAGKSSFALTAAIKNAQKEVPVYYRSDEMRGETVFSRTLSNLASVNNFLLRNPKKLTFPDMQFLKAAQEEAQYLPLIVDEKPGLHIDQILNRAHKYIREKGVELCIFDYLQIIRADGKDIKERVGNVAEAIAAFAREEGVHCMMLSQLTRPDKKAGKEHEPTLSDLRESGRIEDNADVVMLLSRSEHGDACLIPKQRNGPTGRQEILFEASTLTYRDR